MRTSISTARPALQTARASTTRAATPLRRNFHLLVEPMLAAAGDGELPALELTVGVVYLAPGRTPLTLTTRKPRQPALVFEPVEHDGRPRLLALTPADMDVRLNGLSVPPVALLRVRDQLRLGQRAVLHVTEFHDSVPSPPPAALLGRPCALCRLPLTAATLVLICACGSALHCEGPSTPAAERLECAQLGCPGCDRGLRPESGYVWLPEL